jgi:hypothetical protein
MVKLVTQYNNMRGKKPFEIGRGWDGANGPWVYHVIDRENTGSSIARDVRPGSHVNVDINDWLEGHWLNTFRLELVYE